MKLMIVCGGTGGHIYPGIALAKAIKNRNPDGKIIFIGKKKGLEEQIFLRDGWDYRTIIISGMPREFSVKWFSFIFKMILGIIQSIIIINKEKPDIIVGTGAYITVPVILSGKIFRVPELLMEQNTYPGIATRFLARIVNKIAVSFEETVKYLPGKKCIHTGNPVRPEIISKDKESACRLLNFDESKKTLLIFGGSQGAHSINKACIDMKPLLEPLYDRLQMIMITGENDFKEVNECYEKTNIKIMIAPFYYNMENALAVSDMVISRSGASTLAEVTARGIPSILIPYPYATDQHQLKNAEAMVKSGAAYIIPDRDLTGEILGKYIIALLFDDIKLKSIKEASKKLGRPDAIENIAKIVEELIAK
ncbi:undecaprenyldiphospho-muramoylpentapeptide beta-N-acetylglucosaminyltransferase [Candidatus Desantisbacteria bacterium]|nr:undecaprenyldiphospho-muramoylpentapeptide beta-N-acetylglucosaminyltransferase [Candidatus Desantisbacteria bacterium]